MPHRLVLGLFLLSSWVALLQAQVNASLSGRIEDSSNAAIGGATVIVTNTETGATRVATTDDTGAYQVLSVPVGPYQVKVEKAGFKTEVRNGINLEVGRSAVVNLQL